MGGVGGIGAFAQGFTNSFMRGREQKRLREQAYAEQLLKQRREERLSEQFDRQQDFRESQAEELRTYREQVLEGQAEQRRALRQYQEGQTQLQQKQLEIQQRRFDLDVWKGLDQAFDPTKPKAYRQMVLKQTAKQLNIDPKSDEYKDFAAMVNDDEASASIKSGLAALAPEAEPGQIAGLTKSIMTGQMPMKDAVEALQGSIRQKKMGQILTGGSEAGGEGEQGGVPTRRVQTSRITNPTPMSQQKGMGADQQGGTLPVPGMEATTGTVRPAGMTVEQAREKAAQLALLPDEEARSQAQVLLQWARDMEAGKKIDLQVVVDPENRENNKYVTKEQALGMEAPSSRNVKTPQEEASAQILKGLADQDIKKVEKYSADAEAARDMSGALQAFRVANESGQFETGTAGGFRANIARLGRFIGLSDEALTALDSVGIGSPEAADLLESTANQINLLSADKLGRVTNMSLGFIQSAGPGIFRTKEGNELITDLMQRGNDRAIKIEAKMQEYIERYRGKEDNPLRPKGKESFFDWVAKERAKPLVDSDFVNRYKGAAEKGNKLGTLGSLIEGAFEDGSQLEIAGDKYDVVGKTEWKIDNKPVKKQFPIVKMQNGEELPYIEKKEDRMNVPPGERFLWVNPDTGEAVVAKRKRKQ